MHPAEQPLSTSTESDSNKDMPVTCQWKQPRTRKESTIKFSDVNFQKHVFGRVRNDPRPTEYRGSAPSLMDNFLKAVKGKGLGVSILLDKSFQSALSEPSPSSNTHYIGNASEIKLKVDYILHPIKFDKSR